MSTHTYDVRITNVDNEETRPGHLYLETGTTGIELEVYVEGEYVAELALSAAKLVALVLNLDEIREYLAEGRATLDHDADDIPWDADEGSNLLALLEEVIP